MRCGPAITSRADPTGFFTLALGKVVGVEEMTRTKVFAVLARYVATLLTDECKSASSCPEIPSKRGQTYRRTGPSGNTLTSDSFLGVVLVTKSDSSITPASSDNLPSQPLLGDALALLSAAMYAVYVIWMKVAIGDEERADMRLLLGYVSVRPSGYSGSKL